MPPDPVAPTKADRRARLDRYPYPPPPAEQRLSPEQEGEDDRLEPPGVDTRAVLVVAAVVALFIAASLTLMAGFFRLETRGETTPPPKTFPLPRLEASIDPRVVPAVQPGPAQARAPMIPVPAAAPLSQAMQAIAAKGVHAYDSPLSTAAPAAGDPR